MLRLNCFITVSPGNRESVIAAARRLTEASRQQDGCVGYDILESATRHDSLMIVETWRDRIALDAHSASEVFKNEVGFMKSCAVFRTDIFEF